ncbi:MAG TPA: HAD hydrolase-like protein, partial [Thermodesulfovibrionia bacterium]|nr:HAD hydrolase-like protein [Thermodesulfovibrionia bacterium]
QNKMKKVSLFDGVEDTIRELEKDFNLVIISATDDELIKDYLGKQEFKKDNKSPLYRSFKYIFGKQEPDFQWRNINRKSQLIYKVTSIVGVPVERMVYVGDNDGDFKASQSIKIDFIEARLFGEEVKKATGKESLIEIKKQTDKTKFFTKWEELRNVLEENVLKEVEQAKKERLINELSSK